jgi:polyhydroxyalkanoate synthesis repressor PhaR
MPPLLVKKYGNRRLYDTEDSKYVRLGELADKVRRGTDVRVVDAATGADLTAETLVQIIFEDKSAARLLPVSLLQQMIRMGDDALAEFLGRYVTWALEIYVQTKRGIGGLTPFSPFTAFSSFMPGFGAPRPPVEPPTPEAEVSSRAAPPPPPRRDDDVAELRRELDELKRSLKRKPR